MMHITMQTAMNDHDASYLIIVLIHKGDEHHIGTDDDDVSTQAEA